jgi:hypothetical protein
MTKILVIALTAVAVWATGDDRAVAQGQAWCLIGGNSVHRCGYYTFEQCLASRAGGSSHCAPNPNYLGNRSDANRPARSERRR